MQINSSQRFQIMSNTFFITILFYFFTSLEIFEGINVHIHSLHGHRLCEGIGEERASCSLYGGERGRGEAELEKRMMM